MKSAFKIVSSVFLFLLGCYLLLRYVLFPIVPVSHLYDSIPVEADYVLLVDVEELLSLSCLEFISNPEKGNPFEDEDDLEDDSDELYDLKDILRKGLWNGLKIPEQVIIYKSEQGNKLMTVLLPLSDKVEFQGFLEKIQEKTKLVYTDSKQWVDSNVTITIGEDFLKLGLGELDLREGPFEKTDIWSQIIEENEKGALLRLYSGGKQSPEGVAYLYSKKGGVEIDFEAFEVIPFRSIESPKRAKAVLNVQVGPDAYSRSDILRKKTLLSELLRQASIDPIALDSIWDGRFGLWVNGVSSVQEEIVTYAYNDDFEKVEQRIMQERLEFDFQAELGLREGSDSLFYKKSWVKPVKGHDLFVLYPLQEVRYREEEAVLYFSSANPMDAIYADSLSTGNLLFVDFRSLQTSWNNKMGKEANIDFGLDRLTADINATGTGMRCSLGFQNKEKQGVFSLLEALDK